ncbi:MAG: molybdate ABC transporter permease subunit [Microthrixaceae bacterium]
MTAGRRPPVPVVLGAAVTVAFFAVPLLGLLQRVSWSTLVDDLSTPDALSAFGRPSPVGGWLYEWFGLQLTFSTAGAILAETFVALLFSVITVDAGLRSMDRRYEDVAATLGASPWEIFRRFTLPIVARTVAAGAVLAWARALGEFGATITFAGNIVGRTQTLPLAVYLQLEANPDVAVALSLVLLVVPLGVIVALRERWLGSG